MKTINYELDQNGKPKVMFCVECSEKEIALYVYEGNSLCEEHFKNKNV